MANISVRHRIEVATVGLPSLGHLLVDLYPLFLAAAHRQARIVPNPSQSPRLHSHVPGISEQASLLHSPGQNRGEKLMFWGPIMAAVGMNFIGFLPSYALFLPFLVFGGLGVFGTGVLADNLGMERAMGLLLYLPIAAHVLAFFLPGKNFFPGPTKKPLILRQRTGNLIF